MKQDIYVKNGSVIPEHELEISVSRSGGPGGQHVNKTSTRVTVQWNVKNSQALDAEQKERVLKNLGNQLTAEGNLVIHNSSSRSQLHNKKMAFDQLAEKVRKALHVPKKRRATKIPETTKATRLESKKQHGMLKKLRSPKSYED